MKVYLFTYHQACNDEVLGTTTRVFSTREKALNAFKEWKDEEIEYTDQEGWEIDTDTEDHFEAYEDGYYVGNHSEGWVGEYEVE